jgi:3'-phosphoadenosine 5'-phosphosulfate sulfotransferase (PAPS reductase)/FAD synthetase
MSSSGGRPVNRLQGELFALPAAAPLALDLPGYDVILVNISGGKDSQAALDETVRAADSAGVRDRIVTVFCDLGDDDEWPGTRELAAEHAAHYGLRHEVVCREVISADGERVQQTLSEHIEQRGMWPDAARRYCTVICTKSASLIIGLRVEVKGGGSGSSPSADGGPGSDPARWVGRAGRAAESAVRAG